MSIKQKLFAIMILLDIMLAMLGVSMVWKAAQNARQVRLTEITVTNLYLASQVRAHISRQMKDAMDYLMTGEKRHKEEFEKSRVVVQTSLREWGATGQRSGWRKTAEADQHEKNVEGIKAEYEAALEKYAKVFALNGGGHSAEAFRLMEGEAEPWVEQVLFRSLDESVAEELVGVEAMYDAVLLRMGSVPWGMGESLQQVRKVRSALRYYGAVEKTQFDVNWQASKLRSYLISGADQDEMEVAAVAEGIVRDLREWEKALPPVEGLIAGGNRQGVDLLWEVERQYDALLLVVYRTMSLKKSGKGGEAYRLLEEKGDPQMDGLLLPDIADAIDQVKNIISGANKSLLQMTGVAGAMGALALLIAAMLILVLSGGVIRGMIRSIDRLKDGVEQVRAGRLNARIELQGSDELAQLAASFNGMCDQLERSRQEILDARDQSEHTARELQQSNDELRNFTYIFFHDLREPLVNLKGFASELQATLLEARDLVGASIDRLDERISGRLTRALQKDAPDALLFINASVHRMDLLFNAVVNLAHLGRRTLKPELLSMEELVQAALAKSARESDNHGAKVTVQPLPKVVADRHSIQLIIGHLLDNALKYPEHGRSAEVVIGAEAGAQETIFHIRDNGRGIGEGDLEKIFDIFRRAGHQDVAGAGMGLSYVKTLVQRHGGRLWCESVPGVGSTFSFSLPVQSVNGEASP
jgi:signal transduction histidine kinase